MGRKMPAQKQSNNIVTISTNEKHLRNAVSAENSWRSVTSTAATTSGATISAKQIQSITALNWSNTTANMRALSPKPSTTNKKDKSTDSSNSSEDSDEDSDSSSNSSSNSNGGLARKKKPSNALQFSVMQSDTAGLRMKIAAIPPSTLRINNNLDLHKIVNSRLHKTHKKSDVQKGKKKADESSSTITSCCSECSDSDSDTSAVTIRPSKGRPLTTKTLKTKRTTTSSDNDSDSSSANSSGKSSFRKTKLSPLPKRLDKLNIMSASVYTNKLIKDQLCAEEGASSSDMELPALVSAAIQRVENCSDGDSPKAEQSTQYTSSLLRDFMVKTQMLGSETPSFNVASSSNATCNLKFDSTATQPATNVEVSAIYKSVQPTEKRKRGRPKKQPAVAITIPISESPDSGITSTPHSPLQLKDQSKSLVDATSKKKKNKSAPVPKATTVSNNLASISLLPKLNISNLEKSMYATERVLYPPRRKKRDVSVSSVKSVPAEDLLDPVWRKIDINKKFRRPSMTGYKSDGGTVCSKILAAQSNYVGTYGSTSQRILSGYKSDYSYKSKRSGYKSDYSLKAKSCGYRSDCSGKHLKKVRRKRRLKMFNTKSPVNDLDILQLAGLSLGQSEESSRDSLQKTNSNLMKKGTFRKKSGFSRNLDKSTTGKDILTNLCERVTKRLSGLDNQLNNDFTLADLNKSKNAFPKSSAITCRRSSAVSRCSSRSTSSRMHVRKRRRKRLKSRLRLDGYGDINLSKIDMQIDMLIDLFSTLCHINNDRTSKDRDSVPSTNTNKTSVKRVFKKRKASENIEANSTNAAPSKRRYKKTLQTQSPDDHKLPLKKRHYLLTPDGKHLATEVSSAESKSKSSSTVNVEANSTGNERLRSHTDDTSNSPRSSLHRNNASHNSKIKSITPKKRHLLETPLTITVSADGTSMTTASKTKHIQHSPISTTDVSSQDSSTAPLSENIHLKYQQQCKKNDLITRKRNRLEGLVSRIMQPSSSSNSSSSSSGNSTSSSGGNLLSTDSVKITKSMNPTAKSPGIGDVNVRPPPGVFESTIDLEVQIPPVSSLPPFVTKTEIDSPRTHAETLSKVVKDEPNQKGERVLESLLNKTGGHLLLKKKRKKQNRTGFPTVRRKKKKYSDNELSIDARPLDSDASITPVSNIIEPVNLTESVTSVANAAANCDRVPQSGETADTFIERNSRPRLSVVSLERLQGKVQTVEKSSYNTCELILPAVNKLHKRMRDSSTESTNAVSKKHKRSNNDSQKSVRQTPNKNIRDPRDVSSDNEPLINFVKSRRTRTKAVDDSLKSKNSAGSNIEVKTSISSITHADNAVSKIEQDHTLNSNDKVDVTVKLSSISKSDPPILKSPSKKQSAKLLQSSVGRIKSVTANNSPNKKQKSPVPTKVDMGYTSAITKNVKHKENRIAEIERTTRFPVVKLKILDQSQFLFNKQPAIKSIPINRESPKKEANVEITAPELSTKNKTHPIVRRMPVDKRRRTVVDNVVVKIPVRISGMSNDILPKSSKEVASQLNETVKKQKLEKAIVPAKKAAKRSVQPIQPPLSPGNSNKSLVTSKEPATKLGFKQKIDSGPSFQKTFEEAVARASDQQLHKTNQKNKHKPKESIVPLKANENSEMDSGQKTKTKRSKNNRTPLHKQIESDLCSISSTLDTDIPDMPDTLELLEQDPLPENEGTLIPFNSDESSNTGDNPKKNPKNKKRYLCAGLFSDYYKDLPKSMDKSISRSNSLSDEYTGALLPPPPYCEKFFRQSVRDFLLPYDLWWAQQNGKLPGRNTVPSWNYKKIRTNVYADGVRPNLSTDQQQICSCKPETACGDDCLNRLMYTECTPKACPCSDKCQNTKIQRHIVAPGVERFMTQNKGWGVKAKLPIKKGIYILEYVGEVVTEREFKDRMATLYTQDNHHYCLNLDGGLVIDGHRMGSDGRFVNHSCSPNCEMQKWCVNGLFRMALFAMRNIEPGEELTYDYNFSLFNPTEGQPCRCDTPQCRGVIGGKSQRIKPIVELPGENNQRSPNKGRTGRPRKNKANKNQSFMHSKAVTHMLQFQIPSLKEMSFIKKSNCFMMRSLRKIQRCRKCKSYTIQPALLSAQISALRTPRNIRTRGVTIAETDPAIEKTARIAGILREICEELGSCKDLSGQNVSTRLNLPSKKKCPTYYDKILKPIDLAGIEANVEKGLYTHPSLFDDDVLRMFSNAIKFYNIKSTESDAVQILLETYVKKKEQCLTRLANIIGNDSLSTFLPNKPNQLRLLNVDPNEDIIRCICGLFIDEGVMIQCSKCLVWQHTQCTGADTSIDNYLCDKCDEKRIVNLEIQLDERNVKGYQCYLSLLRGDLQIRQTDTVYVLRDIPIAPSDPSSPIKKHTYETIGEIDFGECDIFRIEQLWKDNDGKRFAYGHHYLRPHETYHEPTRKFYKNEVVRVPLYEEVPIEMIMGRCWVLDTTTFCKGRPVGSVEEHVYICELRVDKSARSFAKISKHMYPVCQKSYAFQKFEQKLKIQRNYMPHDVNLVLPKPKKRKVEDSSTVPMRKNSTPIVQLMPPPPKTLNEKRTRLEGYLSGMMTKLKSLNEDVQPLNLSYLLTGRGTRRRITTTNVPL